LYNKYHKFPENSLFVIDEASMIDVCLFNALLESIPENAFVYIMGDKNQLPSVECGSVFGDLLKKSH
jgi:exodeoxyribonuclease V alpha subunit